jgi:chlorobactene glucosyltransferase
VLLWIGVVAWMCILAMGSLNAILVPLITTLKVAEPAQWPLVSFVVPARNEEAGICRAVTSFCTQRYPACEVVVVDDGSTDRTGAILSELKRHFSNLTVLTGEEPPKGWLGKPNALQLAFSRARGDWILMTDADAVHAPDLLRRAVAWGISEKAGMVTIRPRHITAGPLEAALMSSVNFFFFVATPIWLVSRTRSCRFATGSPVFNLIRRDALEACGGFACLKESVVDDLEIGRQVKQAGYRAVVAFAGDAIQHRMYRGAGQVVEGFGKTTFPTIRRTPWILPAYITCAIVLSLLPYLVVISDLVTGTFSAPALLSLALMHLVFAGMAWRYNEPWCVIFLNPIREVGWLWIFARSCYLYYRKGLEWRGRRYGAF